MKKHFLITLLLTTFAMVATAQTKRIAILETIDKENKVPYAVEVMVRSNLTKVISNTEGYEGYDRVNISEIMDEHDFERTGLVSEEQIRQLGIIAGADYLLVSEAVKFDESNIFVTAKILNVESAKTEGSENALMGMTAQDIQHGCESLANRLLGLPDPIIQNGNGASTVGVGVKPSKNKKSNLSENVSEQQENKPIIEEPNSSVDIESINGNEIVKDGKQYFLRGKPISKDEYISLLQSSCPEAYSNYRKGKHTQTVGWIMLGVGVLAGTSISIGDFSMGSTTGTIIGSALIISSVPVLIIGGNKKNNSYKIYNQYCAQSSVSLGVYPTGNGIGVCLNF